MSPRKPLREYTVTTRDQKDKKLRTDSVWAETSTLAAREALGKGALRRIRDTSPDDPYAIWENRLSFERAIVRRADKNQKGPQS